MAHSWIEDKFVKTFKGPFAVVRQCLICGHIEKVKRGVYGVGRGYGFREGNKARGRIIQHIREKHPEKLKN
jgi:hypothetical protein